ncbi:MAG: hypothetical protein AAF799_17125 [Myxococcota bacterium]
MRWSSLVSWPLLSLVSLGCRSDQRPPPVPFDQLDPKVGDAAPAFSLDALGGSQVQLKDLCGAAPTVLIFGSYS